VSACVKTSVEIAVAGAAGGHDPDKVIADQAAILALGKLRDCLADIAVPCELPEMIRDDGRPANCPRRHSVRHRRRRQDMPVTETVTIRPGTALTTEVKRDGHEARSSRMSA
jgi:hypothetical protein